MFSPHALVFVNRHFSTLFKIIWQIRYNIQDRSRVKTMLKYINKKSNEVRKKNFLHKLDFL
jgi:hypothetical protein